MKIHILRHATPMSHSASGRDADRSLSVQGYQECELLGAYLRDHVVPCEVWCSSAVRTCETLREILRYWHPYSERFHPEFYLAPKETYLAHCWQSESDKDLLIIGHNFGLSDLLVYLSGEEHVLQPAELFTLDFQGMTRKEISASTGIIAGHFCPPDFSFARKYR